MWPRSTYLVACCESFGKHHAKVAVPKRWSVLSTLVSRYFSQSEIHISKKELDKIVTVLKFNEVIEYIDHVPTFNHLKSLWVAAQST